MNEFYQNTKWAKSEVPKIKTGKRKSKVVSVYSRTEGCRGIAPLILNLSTKKKPLTFPSMD